MPLQFSSRSIFAAISSLAILCWLFTWILNSGPFDRLIEIPLLFVPGVPMMGVGICLIPFFCLPALLIAGAIVIRTSPRPYSAIIFFGLQLTVFVADLSYWDAGSRFIIASGFASTTMLVESAVRKLPKLQLLASGIAILISIAWYFAILCVVVSASV